MVAFPDFHVDAFETAKEREWAASQPVAERQRMVMQLLAPTPTFQRTVKFLQSQHMPVPGGRHSRGSVCGILGPSRVGKSWAVKAYCNSLGEVDGDEAVMARAVYVDCNKRWTPLVFAQALADAAGVRRKGRASAAALLDLVRGDVVEYGVELVVIDDAQWMFANPSAADQVKGFLIGLAEARSCNVVLVGTEPIDLVVRSEESLVGRGQFPTLWLEPSAWRDGTGPGEFHLALGTIDRMLPFRQRSKLDAPVLAAHLYHVSAGKLGLAMNYLIDATNIAMSNGAASVTMDDFHAAAQSRRRRGDAWDPFESAIDVRDPGTARSDFDDDDDEAAGRIRDMLEVDKGPPRTGSRGGANRGAETKATLTKRRR
ncbi:ATP-binding protein [Lichenibacterium ramalinae]|uniref:ATP-binding protein n=1 Tax=Lichenibacterium ramalinae TaxID=2316527 RepID=A0A4Q2R6B6_9HYPH|nr:ATP-binding protein [Lichenibacterium ramalinae]RYB02116.1 ATP-binding protein [Lichenibacterium ramalinae]